MKLMGFKAETYHDCKRRNVHHNVEDITDDPNHHGSLFVSV